jgi:CheY-like chemotaxis protein/anti-sigma regulatory factor (Ser/Thr protein kinase)
MTPRLTIVPIRVLLVDDVVEVRRLVRTSLRFRGGFEVVGEAADGAEAVRLASRLRPDVVVVSLDLPEISGGDLLAQLRAAAPEAEIVLPEDRDLGRLVEMLESVVWPNQNAAIIDLPHDLSSVSRAREFVRARSAEWGIGDPLDDALLVVSELATNALTHAGSSYRVRFSATAHALRIEVDDDGVGTPEPQPLTDTDEHGRGLYLVSALASSWGMAAAEGGGKRVWAELALSSAATADEAE